MEIKLVPENLIDRVWPFVEPLAEELERKTDGEHTPDSLYAQIRNGHALWVALENGEPVSFVTTFVTPDGSGRNIGVMLAGAGEQGRILDWKDSMEGAIADWFQEQGCVKSVFAGPRAWAKFFPNFKIKHVLYERALA